MADEQRDERLKRIHRDQGVMSDLISSFPKSVNQAMKQMYYDINFLLEEIRVTKGK